jgi:hypothetical protein
MNARNRTSCRIALAQLLSRALRANVPVAISSLSNPF